MRGQTKEVLAIAIRLVRELLADQGLVAPEFSFLKPNNENYRCLLLQPGGPIFASEERIGHLNATTAQVRCLAFLQLAAQRAADLAITPEYCTPWAVLREALDTQLRPPDGGLWVLGCESISSAELAAFKQQTSQSCRLIYETQDVEGGHGSFLDPIVYFFSTTDKQSGQPICTLIVQFKTCASRDEHFLEQQNLKLGRTIYRLRNSDNILSLASIICSDAFSIASDRALLQHLTDRATLIHIQLNPKPRHRDYRLYRGAAFGMDAEITNCDIVCLNWAKSIEQHGSAQTPVTTWRAAGSTWYVPELRCSTNDQEVLENHEKGMYYTFMEERRHALVFNYEEAVFELSAPKAISTGSGVLKNNLGPLAKAAYRWAENSHSWEERTYPLDSGFDSITENNEISARLSTLFAGTDALGIERALALSSGSVTATDDWFRVDQLDSCSMKPTETVLRVTFAQDICEEAADFRHARTSRAAQLGHLLATHQDWPPQIKDLLPGGHIMWRPALPHCNVHYDGVQPGLIAHLGDHPAEKKIHARVEALFELLRREGATHQRRLCVCYTKNMQLQFAPIPALTRFDYSGGARTDITDPLTTDDEAFGSNS